MGRNWKRAQPHGPAPRQFLTRQLFFKWIKQHLRIKAFFGTNENSVKTQIWIAVSVYVLVAIVKKRLGHRRKARDEISAAGPSVQALTDLMSLITPVRQLTEEIQLVGIDEI